jgi:nucleotide-binding universal stress UspA family protein
MTIVVGYVPKPEGRAALTRAVSEAKLRGTDLVVVNSSAAQSLVDESLASREELDEVRRQLEEAGVKHDVRRLVRGREAAEELIEAAEETGADFIVIGLRRRTPVGKFITGSDAQRILLTAPCPVLAVKADV